MPKTHTSITGRLNEVEQDSVWGLMTQDAGSTNSTLGGLAANGDIAVGQSFTLIGLMKTAAALKVPTDYTVNFCSKNAPWKFRVVGIRERLGRHHGRWRDVVLLERRSARAGIDVRPQRPRGR